MISFTENIGHLTAIGSVKTAMNAMSMIYEPTLRITNPGILETRNGDTTNPIWGFKYIRPVIGLNDRALKLNKDSSYVNSIVLA